MRDSGVDTYNGNARFTGKNSITIGETTLTGKHIFIGTGAIPRPLKIEGSEHVVTSDQLMECDSLPQHITFIGGGYISFEFAHVAARAGSRVVMLEMSEKLLPNFDQDLVALLVKASKEIGITTHTNMPVRSVEKVSDGYVVHAGEDGEHRFKTEWVVHGAGRVPNIKNLGLREAQLETSGKGIVVNKFMQSISNPSIYAAGDVVATPFLLTPTAALEARVAAKNIVDGNGVELDMAVVPSAVYTTPVLASVGMGENEAREKM